MYDFKKYFSQRCDEALRNILREKITGSFFFVNTEAIGFSVLKRPVECFSIGNSPNKVLLCGGFHGMEWITCHLLYMFIINVSRSIINRKPLCGENLWETVKKRELENGIIFPSKTRYGGEFPESEHESRCIADFCRSNTIISATAFHSQGEEIYWSYGKNTPQKGFEIAEKMSKLSGYSLSFPEEMAVGGGFKDWIIQKLHIPSFTVEVGKGENPLDISQLDGIYNKLEKMLVYLISA